MVYYSENVMLNGIKIYSSDVVWRQIFSDFGAVVTNVTDVTDVNFDDIEPNVPISTLELKSLILSAMDNSEIIMAVFGGKVELSRVANQIVTYLYKSGGMSAEELKVALGYAHDAATHTVDTAIYSLRKMFGHDFIQNDNGVYRLGKL